MLFDWHGKTRKEHAHDISGLDHNAFSMGYYRLLHNTVLSESVKNTARKITVVALSGSLMKRPTHYRTRDVCFTQEYIFRPYFSFSIPHSFIRSLISLSVSSYRMGVTET